MANVIVESANIVKQYYWPRARYIEQKLEQKKDIVGVEFYAQTRKMG
jgi:hypothetical protein